MSDIQAEIEAAKREAGLQELYLDWIGFEMHCLDYLGKLYVENMWDNKKAYEISGILKGQKEALKLAQEEYERRFGHPPNSQDAWRVFGRNRAAASESGREPGNTNNHNPKPKQ